MTGAGSPRKGYHLYAVARYRYAYMKQERIKAVQLTRNERPEHLLDSFVPNILAPGVLWIHAYSRSEAIEMFKEALKNSEILP